MLDKADYETEIAPLLNLDLLKKKKLANLNKDQFSQLNKKEKSLVLPLLDQKLRDYISLRPIIPVRQKEHYQRG